MLSPAVFEVSILGGSPILPVTALCVRRPSTCPVLVWPPSFLCSPCATFPQTYSPGPFERALPFGLPSPMPLSYGPTGCKPYKLTRRSDSIGRAFAIFMP
ncbi:unnamed protein product [Linum trigynum]|uniref:Secreted protein n=1 Tax=Linum trigynum TaxID=586398 RepID=A0AAV2DIE3_9ROSI